MSRIARLSRVALAASIVLPFAMAAGGCWVPGYRAGGQQATRDLYVYESTVDMPQTVTLIDSVTREEVWQVEVPVNRMLVVRFFDTYDNGEVTGSMMRWRFFPKGEELGGELENAMPVPKDRMLVTSLRESPIKEASDRRDSAPPPPPPAAAPEPLPLPEPAPAAPR